MAKQSIEYSNSRYKIGLPYKFENEIMPESKINALNRLHCTERTIQKKNLTTKYRQKI